MGTIETIAVWLVVGVLAALAVYRLWRTARGRERCGGCGGACGRPTDGPEDLQDHGPAQS
jgi:hypothetical protein